MRTRTALLAALALVTSLTACAGSDDTESAANYPSQGPGLDDRVRSGRRQRHHGPHDGQHHQGGEAVHRGTSWCENREGGSGATGWGYLFRQKGDGLRHLDDVGVVHHHAAAGRHRLDLRGLHPGRACSPPTTRCSSCPGKSGIKTWRGVGRRSPRTRARSRSAASAPSTSTSSSTRCSPTRPGTRSTTCPTTRRARCRRRCCPAHWTRWSPTRARSSARSRPATMHAAAVHRQRAAAGAAGRTDRRVARLQGPAVHAARPDPAAGRARGGAGVVDRHHEEGRRDRRSGRPYLEENYLVEDVRWGEDFTAYLDDDQRPRSRSSSTRSERCDTMVTLRHEQQREGHPPAPRLGAAARSSSCCCSWRCSPSTPRWASPWSGGPPPAASAPASSRGSSGCLGLALTLVALVQTLRAPADEDETVALEDEVGDADLGQHPRMLVLFLVVVGLPGGDAAPARRDHRLDGVHAGRAQRCSTGAGTCSTWCSAVLLPLGPLPAAADRRSTPACPSGILPRF